MREQSIGERIKRLLTLFTLIGVLYNCGKDNEIQTAPRPVAPIPPVAIQPAKNLLLPFDHSFEEVEMVQRDRSPVIRLPSTNHFRVTGTRQRDTLFDVTSIAAQDGQKALRLFRAEVQSLIIPTAPRGEKSPLIVSANKRYSFKAYVRFPRQNRNIPEGEVGLRLYDNEEDVGEIFKSFVVQDTQNFWYEIRAEFEIPKLVNNAKIVLRVSGSDDLLIDNLEFKEIR
jgi:hypothetical protein